MPIPDITALFLRILVYIRLLNKPELVGLVTFGAVESCDVFVVAFKAQKRVAEP